MTSSRPPPYAPQFRFVAKGSDEKLAGGVITCGDCAATFRQVKRKRGFPIQDRRDHHSG
jgi:hypothetical protein